MKNATKYTLMLMLVLMTTSAAAKRRPLQVNRLSPRITRPVQASLLLKGVDIAGAEIGVRTIEGHVELHMGAGSSVVDTIDRSCNQSSPTCNAPAIVNWNAGARWYPLYGGFSPYVSVGAMGAMNVAKSPVGLIGAGLHWQERHNFTANLGVEFAIGEKDLERRVIPTLTLGYAF